MKIYTDGGSRGNPGKAACSYVVVSNNKIIKRKSKYLGIKTNNEAEYNAIILALKNINTNNNKNIHIISDSELVIKQLNGEYKIKKQHLRDLYSKIQNIIAKNNLNIKFSNLRREDKFISSADALLNQELDKHF